MQHRTTTAQSCDSDVTGDATTIHGFESSALIAHIQSATEHQKALLARELHDELGGLLVGAVMDLAWAEQHLLAPPAELRQKLVRARQSLASAIDLKRRLIEELRPTLLDNVGLFAALRWHVQAACNLASMPCTITLPGDEKRFIAHVPIALFRIVQESIAVIVAQISPAAADFSVTLTNESLDILFVSHRVAAAGAPGTADPRGAAPEPEPHALAAVRYRTNALGGVFSYADKVAVGIVIAATFPLESVLAAD